MKLHKDAYAVLELAETYTLEADVPDRLRNALDYCIKVGLVCIEEVKEIKTEESGRETAYCAAGFPRMLIIQATGEAHLAERRMVGVVEPEHKWSDAKPPAVWCKNLNIAATTFRQHIKKGKLIVDKISTKSVRIRLDSLERYLGK